MPVIRPATQADLAAIAAIESVSFSDPWSLNSFSDSLAHDFVRMCVVEDDAGVAGYSVVWVSGEECELANLAVDPARRRSGLGAVLLDALLERAHEEALFVIFLEVRASNTAAQTLYASRGFHEVGRRPMYYKNPAEDALILRRDLR
ncbi:MAG: ribosomal protein S18-alanine N-acetyltransferase [Gemmatimonadaceae bacterium]|nr:ribosomal protein S18-alanine N-acetyltransferase [Gemmatimonadaceae bacterium]